MGMSTLTSGRKKLYQPKPSHEYADRYPHQAREQETRQHAGKRAGGIRKEGAVEQDAPGDLRDAG
jgi:hypothetical protein